MESGFEVGEANVLQDTSNSGQKGSPSYDKARTEKNKMQ